jgi:hypothetical protein
MKVRSPNLNFRGIKSQNTILNATSLSQKDDNKKCAILGLGSASLPLVPKSSTSLTIKTQNISLIKKAENGASERAWKQEGERCACLPKKCRGI